ncbi:MAG: HEAT repeat domain-containing protein [Candidatus Acidiferrales bacterium]
MPSETTIPNARAFVRSLNVLLKFARLYGLEHVRSAAQFDSALEELSEAISAAGPTGLLLGATGSQLLLDGVPLETTPAERSFANLLSAAGIASICFGRGLERHEFALFIRAFMETGSKASGLAEKLSEFSGKNSSGSIRVNEIRFVAEDSAYSDARVAAQLTVRTLGGDSDQIQEWFRSPEKMIQLIAAAEGAAHPGASGAGTESFAGPSSGYSGAAGPGGGGKGTGTGAGNGAPSGGGSFGFFGGLATSGTGSGGGSGAVSQEPLPLSETEMHSLLRLLAQFGEATQGHGNTQNLDATAWQAKLAHLPQNAQVTLRQALAGVMATAPKAKLDGTTLVRLAEDLAIRFALERYQRGEVRVNAVRQLLDKMGQEVETLRKMLRAREDKMAKAGIAVESHADLLDRQFWAKVPESGKKQVLLSTEAWCIPPRNVQQFVEELLGRGESDAAGDILLHYAACVRNKDSEARRKAAIGLGQLAELYSRAASQRLQTALAEIGKQMQEEREQELQSLLSAAFVRLSQEAASRRYYRAMIQALDSLNLLEAVRPSWVQGLRPRLGIENRVSEFIDDAVNSDKVDASLTDVLRRVSQASSEQLAIRLSRTTRRNERERVVELAKAIGEPCAQPLRAALRSDPLSKAASVVGLLSRLDPMALGEYLPSRLSEGQRSFQDAVVRQLAIAGAPERGRVLVSVLDLFDSLVMPFAVDEIGMCGDPETSEKLLKIVEGEALPGSSEFLRVKAIEALGRIRAPGTAERLRHFLEDRKTFGWAYPDEIRTAVAQALAKIDAEWLRAFIPKSGLDAAVLALAPLDPRPERDFVRHRRYRRVRLSHSVPAVVSSAQGKQSLSINVLSLDGGMVSGDMQLAVGTSATFRIPAGMRSINAQAVVRFVRSHQAGFEWVGMGLEDRAKLRRLLVSLGEGEASHATFSKTE